jgi:hypothetical protein
MKIALIADIHGNIYALDAVLDYSHQKFESELCL